MDHFDAQGREDGPRFLQLSDIFCDKTKFHRFPSNSSSIILKTEVWTASGGEWIMENWSTFFFLAGLFLECLGIWLFLRKKDAFFEPIILGFLCFLVGFLA